MTVFDPRPAMTPALEALLHDLIVRVPPLTGLRGDDVLVVALGAHGGAVASVRPFSGCAHSVRVGGHTRRIELGLRPGFFHTGDAPRRVATLLHELLHLDTRAPGQLNAQNRHRVRAHESLEAEARQLARAYLNDADPRFAMCLAHHGEVRLRSWLRRPVDDTKRQRFTDKDVFDAVVHVTTPAPARASWW